ncbi:MAG: hypothetical protein GY930_20665, partial [bacterium]|nr:hypothetical protein [bacterium]
AEQTAAQAPLTMDGWTGQELLALGLHQVSQGHLVQGLASLEDLRGITLDEATTQRMTRAGERVRQLIASRDKLMTWMVANKKKLRWVTDGKATVLKPSAWKDGVLTVKASSKHNVTELAAADMPMAFLALNFNKKANRFGVEWLESYCLAMAGDAKWEAALPKKFADGEVFASDMRGALESIPVGASIQDLADGVAGKGRDIDFKELGKVVKSTEWLTHRKPLLLTLARSGFENQLKEKGLAASLHGKVEELGKGRVRITYSFDNKMALKDFKRDNRWWKEERESYEPITEKSPVPKIKGGELVLQGEQNIVHFLDFEGDMTLEMTALQHFDEDEPSVGTVIAAINASPPYHFARSTLDLLIAIEGPKSKPQVKAARKERDQPYRMGEALHTKLWTSKKKAHLDFHSYGNAEVDFVPNKPGTALIWVHSVDPMGIDELIIEGKPTEASKKAIADRWLKGQLSGLGLK